MFFVAQLILDRCACVRDGVVVFWVPLSSDIALSPDIIAVSSRKIFRELQKHKL